MKNILRIARWEFVSRLRSRAFIFNTFISPLIFALILLLPVYFIAYDEDVSVKLVGVIDLSEKNMGVELQNALSREYRLDNRLAEYEVFNINVNNSPIYRTMNFEYQDINNQVDSISALLNQIKEEREGIYKNQSTPNRQFRLDQSYERLVEVRDEKQLLEIEKQRYKVALDSVYLQQARIMADSMIARGVLSSYLVFPQDFVRTGEVEYHSRTPGDLLDTERLEKALQNIVLRKRLADIRIDRRDMRELLRPVELEKYTMSGGMAEEWNLYAQFYGPLIAVFLLFVAIFTTGGHLFSGVLNEKTNRVMEVLMSYASGTQIMGGKILGMGSLGLFQIFCWFLLTIILLGLGVISGSGLSYLNATNAFYFIFYFALGFLFYGSIFITVASVFSSEYDAQQVNQVLRTLAIMPALLSLLVLNDPNGTLVRVLSYIPFLTPSFMILRIPLSSEPMQTDIAITAIIMLISILFMIVIAGRLFRVNTLMMGKKPTWKEILRWLQQA